MNGGPRDDPRLRDVLLLWIAVAGLAACITLIYLAMRAVMDVGGACADGGPYVSAQPCPDGTPGAMLLGIFGLFGFGALGMVSGARAGGFGWVPLLAWTGLFASLGWNFLDYGVVNPPAGQGIEWGYAIPGVLFQLMAWTPVVFVASAAWGARGTPVAARPIAASPTAHTPENRPPPVPPAHRVETVGPVRREQLQAIDALMGAAIAEAVAETPIDPDRRAAIDPGAAGAAAEREAAGEAPPANVAAPDFSEGTQALLDRLERLADMRDRGLLTPDEYETAKDTVMRELESRS